MGSPRIVPASVDQAGSTSSAGGLVALTTLTMVAFAANSLLTRLALQSTTIDAASFASIRLITGALTLAVILRTGRAKPVHSAMNLLAAGLLFTYATAFTFAYRQIATGAGALVLFASAQLLMIVYGIVRGEQTNLWGAATALVGLVIFLAPAGAAPPLGAALLMLLAGLAWGAFSLLGRGDGSPVVSTASSFLWATPPALVLLWLQRDHLSLDPAGMIHAAVSGSVTSALGYVLWYRVRGRMAAITAGTVQLSVPVLSALMGLVVLGESITLRGGLAALMVLAGVALTTATTRRPAPSQD